MYTFYLDDNILYYPGDPECIIKDPTIELTVGEAGSCEFLLPPENPYYNSLRLRQSMIRVKRDNKEIFCGEVRECPKDNNNIRHVYAVGELAFLHNSRQPQVVYGEITPLVFLRKVIEAHNEQVEERQQFTVGTVTISNGFNPINFQTDHNDTLEAIRSMLIDNLGGVLRVRKSGSTRYLDYITLQEYGTFNTQGVTFGENLMEYAESYSANNVVTAVIPRGAVIEDADAVLQKHVDITTVNGGKNYLVNTTAVRSFGYIWEIVDFDGIDSPADLKAAGNQYLTDTQYEDMELTLSAADLSLMDTSMSAFGLGDRVPVKAPPYGMDRVFPVKSLTLYPQAPQNERLKLSANLRRKGTFTASSASAAAKAAAEAKKDDLTIKAIIMQEMSNIVAQFTGSSGGYKLTEYDENGLWLRDLYMDAPTKAQARNIMQISMAGIAFSKNGFNGPYTSAWTLDGKFCADYIMTGTLMASLIKAGILSDVGGNFSFNLETGACSAKKLSINSTNFNLDTNGNIRASNADLTGATIKGGTITQTSGTEKMTIGEAMIKGKRGNTEVGYIDLSADTDSDDGTVYDAVIGSKSVLRLEFFRQLDIVDSRSGYTVGYFDGNGWHGPVDEEWLPEPTVIYVPEENDGDN